MRRLLAGMVILWASMVSVAVAADKRVALIVGNSQYRNVVALPNPANDAAAMAAMFKSAAFNVVEMRRDLSNADMRRALRDFTEKARDAEIAVVYYAGHGIEVDGVNYLVPIDATLERDTDAFDEAITLDRILQAIEPAKKLRLVILDACRDNPFSKSMKRTMASRSLGRGLAGVEPSRPNTLVAFAAKGGSTAADGDSNSPFTIALLNRLPAPGVELGKAFRLVRDDVMSSTDNRQEPFVYGSLGGADIVLVPARGEPPAPTVASPQAELRRDYEFAERVGTMDAWNSFLQTYPTGFYSELAKAQRNKLTAEEARVAAISRARETSDEKARLAAEGAKASQQAKAAADALAAEQARGAAEQRKAAEEIKVAEAERAKTAAVARAAEADRQAAERKRQTELAALTPPAAMEAKPEPAAAKDLARRLQVELRRVGCTSGDASDDWTAASRKALSTFNAHAHTSYDTRVASLDALDGVAARSGRVCPLECDRGFRTENDRCVRITCASGKILDDGVCKPKPRKPVVAQRHAPVGYSYGGARSKCFAFNGRQVCE